MVTSSRSVRQTALVADLIADTRCDWLLCDSNDAHSLQQSVPNRELLDRLDGDNPLHPITLPGRFEDEIRRDAEETCSVSWLRRCWLKLVLRCFAKRRVMNAVQLALMAETAAGLLPMRSYNGTYLLNSTTAQLPRYN